MHSYYFLSIIYGFASVELVKIFIAIDRCGKTNNVSMNWLIHVDTAGRYIDLVRLR